MSAKKENYKLSASSPSKEPGFVTFQDLEDKEYYFHFNDEKGKPLFYSEGYIAASGRDKAVESVKKNAVIAKRYKEKAANDNFYFVLRAGNHQEIGRSENFTSKEEMKVGMQYFQYNVASAEKGNDEPKKQEFSFQVNLVAQGANQAILGNIKSLQSKRKGNFDGLDGQAMADFMAKDLPKKMREQAINVAQAKNENASKSTQPAIPQDNLQLQVFNKDSQKPTNSLPQGKPYDIIISLAEDNDWSNYSTPNEMLALEIDIKPINNSSFSSTWVEEIKITEAGGIKLTSLLTIPSPGIYRIIATSKNAGGDALKGKTVVNIY